MAGRGRLRPDVQKVKGAAWWPDVQKGAVAWWPDVQKRRGGARWPIKDSSKAAWDEWVACQAEMLYGPFQPESRAF